MKPLLLPLLLLFLAACATPGPGAPDPDGAPPDFGSPGEASYHLLMAEIALQRDRPALAATEYLRAARASEDPEVAARATRVISDFGTLEEGLAAAQRWADLAPGEMLPQRFQARFFLQAGEVQRAADMLALLRTAIEAEQVARPFLPLVPLAMEARDPGVAVAALAAVVVDHPDDASGAYAHAYLALRAGQVALAQSEAQRALRLDPEWTDAALLYARALAAAERTDEALAWLAERPEAGERIVQLETAAMLMQADRTAEARAVLGDLLAADPADTDALRLLGFVEYFTGETAAAREIFLALLASGEYTDDAVFYLGGIAEQAGEIEEAARLYARVESGEHLVTAQVRLALLMYRMGRPELAINHLELFARRNPDAVVELGTARAQLLARLGMFEEALDVYGEILARFPDDFASRYARGLLYVELDRAAEALEDFGHLVAMYPDDPTALNALGYTLADMTERYDQAYQLIYRALTLEPGNPAILDSMGWVLYRQGRPEEALPYIERSWEIHRDAEIAAHLGEVLWSLGRIDEAREIWLEAIVEWPGSQVLLETMGRLDP
ncbi:MAG: tetratricopeptide repeat protein [Gammaproteobacteria bacterium]